MAFTIAAYQTIGQLDSNSGSHILFWNPPNDIVRDNNEDNEAVLLWAFKKPSSNPRVRVEINDEPVEDVVLGTSPGTMITRFFSSRAGTGQNAFRFHITDGTTSITDVTIFYKRKID
jgi:hypothetical protein